MFTVGENRYCTQQTVLSKLLQFSHNSMQNSYKTATALDGNHIILYIRKFLSHKIVLCKNEKK
jgi:hypothetical protein